MPVITLTSDKGSGTPETSIMEMRLRRQFSGHTVISLSHSIEPHQIVQAGDLIKYFLPEFETETIHIAWVDSETAMYKRWLIGCLPETYIIAPDNGLIPGLFLSCHQIFEYYPPQEESVPNTMIHLVRKCLEPSGLEKASDNLLTYPPQFASGDYEYADQILRGRIVYIDILGNLVTSISKNIFNRHASGRKFEIILTRHEKHHQIQTHYSDKDLMTSGMVCRFNRLDRLEIALNRESAAQLLGLRIGKPVMIEFYG